MLRAGHQAVRGEDMPRAVVRALLVVLFYRSEQALVRPGMEDAACRHEFFIVCVYGRASYVRIVVQDKTNRFKCVSFPMRNFHARCT